MDQAWEFIFCLEPEAVGAFFSKVERFFKEEKFHQVSDVIDLWLLLLLDLYQNSKYALALRLVSCDHYVGGGGGGREHVSFNFIKLMRYGIFLKKTFFSVAGTQPTFVLEI